MKKRSLGILLVFVTGVAVGYGLVLLDKQTSIPRLEETDVFEVILSDGQVQRHSYVEIAKEREQLQRLRQQVKRLTQTLSHVKRTHQSLPTAPLEGLLPDTVPGPPEPETPDLPPPPDTASPPESLGTLCAKIFSQPAMQELVMAQVKRQAGELSAVLGLAPEQQEALEAVLKSKRAALPLLPGDVSTPYPPAPGQVSEKSLEEEIRAILTKEQAQVYQEYTERKESLHGAPAIERELLEVSWRLSLSEEQETQARDILQEHQNKLRTLSPASSGGSDNLSPSDRFERFFQEKDVLDQGTAERMKAVLDEDQFRSFLQYQTEKDAEARLFQKIIQSGPEESLPSSPP